jgi:SET domain-containing protein
MSLIIRSSAIHAAGCYTTAPIKKGTRIVEYTGPHISKEEADEKYQNSPTTYLFGLGDGSRVIDGHGTAMFINHSCDPNCESDEIRGRVWISAIRNIAAGEELTYDYCLYDGEGDEATCNCGTANCRRTMYSEDEVKKRTRATKRSANKKMALNGKRDTTKRFSQTRGHK